MSLGRILGPLGLQDKDPLTLPNVITESYTTCISQGALPSPSSALSPSAQSRQIPTLSIPIAYPSLPPTSGVLSCHSL